MSTPFLGEVKMFAGNFAPRGYAVCNGQLLPISQNTALFSLLGTTYGGNGTSNFQLPNLQNSVPVHAGQANGMPPIVLGQTGGEAAVTLTTAQIPAHGHTLEAAAAATTGVPSSGVALAATSSAQYTAPSNLVAMAAPLAVSGGSQPHENRQPYLGLTFVIALQGIYPARN